MEAPPRCSQGFPTADLDYRKLLDETLPARIHTGREYKRLLRHATALMEKPEEENTEAEGRILELLGMLLEEYELREHPLPQVQPAKMLAYLIQQRGIRSPDLADILPKSRLSEILNGKRDISKTQAKQLADFFQVPVDLFL